VIPLAPASGFRRAVAFLTLLGGASSPTPGAVAWFPLVGAAIGLAIGSWWWVVAQAWPLPVAAALVVAIDLGLTGMLHFDGLLDCADGLLSHLSREQRLAVMAAPEVGAYAVAVGVVVLVARWAALATIRPAPLLLAGVWCASRTLMAATMRAVPYARSREGGLATAFLGRTAAASVVAGGLGALALAGGWRFLAGPVAVAAGVAAGIGVVLLGRRQLGGFTGDVLGAAGVVAETVALIVAAAKW
jgi:adenosylcobinamide-GDP ribazoletransferase